jgi:hypothetical protein
MMPASPFIVHRDRRLAPGDVLLLMTDGIEESGRFVRSTEFDYERGEYPALLFNEEEIDKLVEEADAFGEAFDKPSQWVLTPESEPKSGTAKIDFSTERTIEIIEKSMTRGTFELRRLRSVHPDESLTFDFKGLPATAETLVLSVMAVEQVYRLTVAPEDADVEPVQIDAKLVDFLKGRFSEFGKYFGRELEPKDRPDARVENEGADNEKVFVEEEYRYFAGLLQEDQEDDLTILAIRKK